MKDLELIKLAKASIASHFSGKKFSIPFNKEFKEKKGVFVTLKINGDLRGCIGFPYASHSLGEGIVLASKLAAFEDPRFEPLTKEEFLDVKVEVSVLSEPMPIKIEDIEIGKHGLMCEYNGQGGLLLPQVAIENNFSKEEFLDCLCNKAGLAKGSWKKQGFKLFGFNAKIANEEELIDKVQ
ncbi:MAG: AmmeMemoRadiSam system protein A [Candidatus Nanoarchaeia archaeon]